MSQEMSLVMGAFESRGADVLMEKEDIKAREICANFIAFEGAENWHLPDFDWPSMCKIISRSLKEPWQN